MIDGLSKKDVGFVLSNPFIGPKKRNEYLENNPLDSKEEEDQITTVFSNLLLEALKAFEEREDADVSAVLAKLREIYKKAELALEDLDKLGWSKTMRQMTISVFVINAPSTSIQSLTRDKLKARIKQQFLEPISQLCSILRGEELLSKRNWEKHERGDQSLREDWLNSWLDDLVSQQSVDLDRKRLLEQVALFADERVNVLRHNNKNLVFLDWDREFIKVDQERTIHPAIEFLISNSKVESVMLEYFSPELKSNFRGENLPDNLREHPFFKKLIAVLQTHAIGHVDGSNKLKTGAYKRRLFGFDAINTECIKNEKDVLVGDIADSYQYMIARDIVGEMIKTLTSLGLGFGIPGVIFFKEGPIGLRDFQIPIASLGLFVSLMFYRGGIVKQGTFALEPNSLDKLTLHLEDARRLFLAKALNLETSSKSTESKDDDSILIIYPPHHNNRIINYLQNPSPSRELFYQTVYPFLNYSLRRYSHKRDNENDSKQKYSGWSLVKKIFLNK